MMFHENRLSTSRGRGVHRECAESTLTTPNFGIEPTPGLFGTPEWWEQISSARLPLQTLRGIISERYWGSMGDWPGIKVQSDAGETSSWTRMTTNRELDVLYIPGQRIKIDFVLQRHRPESFDRGAEVRQVVEIRVEPNAHMQKLENQGKLRAQDLVQAVALNFALIVDAARKLSELGDIPGVMSGESHRVFIAVDREIQEQLIRERGADLTPILEKWSDRVLAACQEIHTCE